MRKFLAVLWFVIILGSVFIAINIFRPDVFDLKSKFSKNISKTSNQEEQTPPQTYEEHISLGDKFLANKNYPPAIKNYRYALTLNPKNITPYVKLGDAYLKNNEPSKAYDVFIEGTKIAPNSPKTDIGIVQSYFNLKQFEKARDYLINLDPSQDEVKYYNALVLILFKDSDKAKTVFTEITSSKETTNKTAKENAQKFLDKYKTYSTFKEGDPLFLQTLLAKAMTEVEQYNAAIPLLYDVINQKPNYRDAWIILGYSYLKTGKTGDAIDAFSSAETKFPDQPETLFFLGLSYFANNDLEHAVYYLEKAEEKGYEPKDTLNMKLGDLYMQQKKYEEAAQKYDEVLTVNTSNIDIFARAIWLAIEKLNNPAHALELAQKAVTVFPNNAMSYNLLGWAYIAINDLAKAGENLKKALDLDPELDAAYLNIGILYEKQGYGEKAKEFYLKALSLGRDSSIGDLAKIRLQNLSNQKMPSLQAQPTGPEKQLNQ